MVRNIPTRFVASSFLAIVEQSGFNDSIDYFYLPMDFKTGKNVGYAFINFTSPHSASLFRSQFSGKCLHSSTSRKQVEIIPSRLQGLKANVDMFRDSKLVASCLPQYRPLVAVDGLLIPLSTALCTVLTAE